MNRILEPLFELRVEGAQNESFDRLLFLNDVIFPVREENKKILKARGNNCGRYNDGEILVDWRSNWLIKQTAEIKATIKSSITNAQTRRKGNFSALTLTTPQCSIAHNPLNIHP